LIEQNPQQLFGWPETNLNISAHLRYFNPLAKNLRSLRGLQRSAQASPEHTVHDPVELFNGCANAGWFILGGAHRFKAVMRNNAQEQILQVVVKWFP